MSIRKKIILAVSIPCVLLLARLLSIPYFVKDEWAVSGPDRRYYAKNFGEDLDSSKVVKTVVHSGFFSFDKTLDETQSRQLLKVLLDSAHYDIGEWGTPEYTTTLYYLNAQDTVIGKTLFDEVGLTRTLPWQHEQTKYGALKPAALRQVLQLIR